MISTNFSRGTPLRKSFVAHHRASDQQTQSVQEHLENVARLARRFAEKIGLGSAGEILGLVHDLGKFSDQFQSYLQSATGLIDQGEDDYVDSDELKGKVDHSTAGAQLIWQTLGNTDPARSLVAQILSLCVASHHSGLIDCLTPEGEDGFSRRMSKADSKTHLSEVEQSADVAFLERIRIAISSPDLIHDLKRAVVAIMKNDRQSSVDEMNNTVVTFKLGLLVRFLFSCLIDADRTDTADFEKPRNSRYRQHSTYRDWTTLIDRLDAHIAKFPTENAIDRIRQAVSESCLRRASDSRGLFTLTVPTGGGKTLSSLRFALHHARQHGMDRIIYVIPFTSIIDQNARVVREILEHAEDSFGSVVLEHHSNLTPENQSWRAKLLSENWDAPIVFTTNVQFLECLFGSGTREVRRMHQMANSLLIFDEIQTLPVRCVHMFCNALNYLVDHCGTSAVLCTATQPLLNGLEDKTKGVLEMPKDRELMPDIGQLFQDLKRVQILDRTKVGGWSDTEIAHLTVEQMNENGSCLAIVNTKASARSLYRLCREMTSKSVFHLSTSMCPAHRMNVLKSIRGLLGREPIICISTQLIEAGVDVDFGSVIRFAAGMDSIAQAAGRCNRNGKARMGYTHIVNPTNERIDSLEDIRLGKEKTERLLSEFRRDPASLGSDLLNPKVIERYFRYYFYERAKEMDYPINQTRFVRDDSLLRLLSTNSLSPGAMPIRTLLRHSFSSAAKAFKAIDAPTQGIVVPYGEEGQEVVGKLHASFEVTKQFDLLRQAQRYSVNVFPNILQELRRQDALQEVKPDTGILTLSERYYNDEFGLDIEGVTELNAFIC